jgi:AraC-like DNA-binding protein
MLNGRTILDADALTVEDFACRHPGGRGKAIEPSTRHALVFVRRGCFIRSVDGVESLLDPTLAYCMNPGDEQRFHHPHTDGDDCTAIALEPALAASLWGGEDTLPPGPLPIPPRLDLAHRLLAAAARRGGNRDEVAERAITAAAQALEQADARRVSTGRPATARARRVLVEGAREVLAGEPACPLPELSRTLATSPHHLSRIFRAATGHTIARHRMRLRARAVLERLAGGEHNLARLAADLGFADQSHLCRVIRAETGQVPSALRHALRRSAHDSLLPAQIQSGVRTSPRSASDRLRQ